MPFTTTLPVRFHDADAARFMFFAQAFVLAHDAYEDALAHMGIAWDDWFESSVQAAPIRHAKADFRRPVRAGARLAISVQLVRVGSTSFTLSYTASSTAGEHFVVELVHAMMDPGSGQKLPLPDALKQRLTQLNAH